MKGMVLKMKFRIITLALALVLCVGILCGCSKDGEENKEAVTGSKHTGTGETISLPDIEVPTETGTGLSGMDKFYEEQYANMTPDEIAQFEQDLVDLGMTKEDFYSLIYAGGESAAATDATASDTTETAEATEASAEAETTTAA